MKPDTISRSQAIRHLMTDDDSPSGSWFSLAEQKRAVEMEQLARELAGRVRMSLLHQSEAAMGGYWCGACGNTTSLSDDGHDPNCIIARSRTLGLLE